MWCMDGSASWGGGVVVAGTLLTSSALADCVPSVAQLSLKRSQKSGFLGRAFKDFKLLAII